MRTRARFWTSRGVRPTILGSGGTWGNWAGSFATGGGYSIYPAPAYQRGSNDGQGGRGVPDVSADADSTSGIVTTYVTDRQVRQAPASGTSASAPLWAGIVALADQYAHRRLGLINPALYRTASGPLYGQAFNDVVTGNNGIHFHTGWAPRAGYTARPGWDPATGWGTPKAAGLVQLLARNVRSSNTNHAYR